MSQSKPLFVGHMFNRRSTGFNSYFFLAQQHGVHYDTIVAEPGVDNMTTPPSSHQPSFKNYLDARLESILYLVVYSRHIYSSMYIKPSKWPPINNRINYFH